MTTTLARWNPFKEMEDLSNRLSSYFDTSPIRQTKDVYLTEGQWLPMVDIVEDDKEYVIEADLPSLTKNDVKVKVDNSVLYIRGERTFEKEEKGRQYHRTERSYGTFVRSFRLPDDADPARVSAEFKDGVLSVHLQKQESAKPRQIEVKVK